MNQSQRSRIAKLLGAEGGKARAKNLTAEQLSAIGKKGGRPRKNAKIKRKAEKWP
jgi:general stress protein YciG